MDGRVMGAVRIMMRSPVSPLAHAEWVLRIQRIVSPEGRALLMPSSPHPLDLRGWT